MQAAGAIIAKKTETFIAKGFKMAASFLLFLSLSCVCQLGLSSLEEPGWKELRIQVESQSRDYTTGPIQGFYMLSNRDQMRLTIDHPGEDYIWKWAMATGGASSDDYCDLARVYGHGESVSMICYRKEGLYYAYAKKTALTDLSEEDVLQMYTYLSLEHLICNKGDLCLEIFNIFPNDIKLDVDASKAMDMKILASAELKSDPIKIIASESCFLWAYEVEVVGKVGYVFTEPEPTGNEGSYIKYKVTMWITEANVMSESELAHKLPQTRYSGLLTRAFEDKGVGTVKFVSLKSDPLGLEPCLRFSHQAIELSHPAPQFQYDPLGAGIFWTQDFIARTDSISATLSDISCLYPLFEIPKTELRFTIASKQHIAHYGCFVAETRVILDPRQFSFLSPGRNDPQKINIANSAMSAVEKQFVEKKLKHLFGHYVQYVGRPWELESAQHRRDIPVFQNPCMTLEFGFAARGVTYMAQDWLSMDADDISQITLPRFGDDDASPSLNGQEAKDKQKMSNIYVKVFDFAFTPTHMVALMSDSSIFLHPTSINYKGFGFVRDLKFYRPGALVSRRWCASTVTPKEHNMVVPAFSLNGNFIIMQIIPIQETTSMWMPKPTEACLTQKKPAVDPDGKNEAPGEDNAEEAETDDTLQKRANKQKDVQYKVEYCIHRKEAPEISSKLDDLRQEYERREKECEELFPEDDTMAKEEAKKADRDQLDSLLMYWITGTTLIDESDPHFINSVSKTSGKASSTSNYNMHMTFEVDRRGQKMKELFRDNGLAIKSEARVAGQKDLLWLHDVQFEAEERRYMLSVEIKSESLAKTDFSMSVLNAVILNEPIRIQRDVKWQIVNTEFVFSGVLIIQPTLGTGQGRNERLEGNIRSFTTNTALGNYVLHFEYRKDGKSSEDIILYATFDGAHARPLSYYNEPPTAEKKVSPKVRFNAKHPALDGKDLTGVLKPDMTMTQHGIISVLLRKANTTGRATINSTDPKDFVEPRDNYPQSVIIGSIVVPEPLRKVRPFKGSSYVFQRVTSDGEIVYGSYSFLNWRPGLDGDTPVAEDIEKSPDGFYPNLLDVSVTRFLATPFESMLGGNDDVDKASSEEFSEAERAADQDICPFSDFVVHNIPFDFAENEYQTRITAEVVYRGSTIPLEADLLVEFDDSHGISVTGVKEMYDLDKDDDGTVDDVDGDEQTQEDIKIFSITFRPSLVNLQCRKDLFFRTIQINVGCNPFTTMRFIAEAVGLRRIPFERDLKDRDNKWTVTDSPDGPQVTIPNSKVNYKQKKEIFECSVDESGTAGSGYCKVPKKYTKLFKENMYSMHFTQQVVPKFEQFLTRHVRRITGNIFLFNILGGEIKANTTLLGSGCHNLGPTCAPGDKSCGSLLEKEKNQELQEQPWTTTFLNKIASSELDYRTDVYQRYRSCFSQTRETLELETIRLDQDLPARMRDEEYWLFNTTNFNAFKLEKHRNMIYIIRAVVLNTPDNPFTFCKKLETFFLLQLTGISPARHPLNWKIYLGLLTLILFIFLFIYFCFAWSSQWQSQVSSRRIREEEERGEREAEAKESQGKGEDYARWAKNLRNIAMNKGKGKVMDSKVALGQPIDTGLENVGDNVEGRK